MKRVIFTLLYDSGKFVLSRNFRLQKIGDIDWLFENYKFEDISYGLDELLVLDISREKKDFNKFCEIINLISSKCFVPLTAGGNLNDINEVKNYFENGADKIFLNNAFHNNSQLCKEIISIYGKQSLIAGIDIKKKNNEYFICKDHAQITTDIKLKDWIKFILNEIGAGEVLVQSIDRDGTANGLELDNDFLENFTNLNVPLIIMGGAGKFEHFIEALNKEGVDAISTANLLNFIGDSFVKIKQNLIKQKIQTVEWNMNEMKDLKGINK